MASCVSPCRFPLPPHINANRQDSSSVPTTTCHLLSLIKFQNWKRADDVIQNGVRQSEKQKDNTNQLETFCFLVVLFLYYGVGGVFTELLASHCKKYKPKKVNTLYKSKVVGGGENDGGGEEGDKGGMRRLFQFKKMVMEKRQEKKNNIFHERHLTKLR